MEKALRPALVVSNSRSASMGSTMAVEERERPNPVTAAAAGVNPNRTMVAAAITTAVTATCAPPSPRTDRRITQRRAGRNSSPIRNSSMMTPSSETCRIASTSVTSPSPPGPMTSPAAR